MSLVNFSEQLITISPRKNQIPLAAAQSLLTLSFSKHISKIHSNKVP
jgi:hypothetical protein